MDYFKVTNDICPAASITLKAVFRVKYVLYADKRAVRMSIVPDPDEHIDLRTRLLDHHWYRYPIRGCTVRGYTIRGCTIRGCALTDDVKR